MPYFQRKPIEGLTDAVLSNLSIPGLPSRGRTLPGGAAVRLVNPSAATTGIVEQAAVGTRIGAAEPQPGAFRAVGRGLRPAYAERPDQRTPGAG